MTHFATADELDDDGFFAAQLETFTRWARDGQGRAAGARRARRQQRRDAARRSARTSTWCAAGSRSTAWTRSARIPPRAALEPALELSSYVAEVKRVRARARAPATGGGSSPSATPSIGGAADRLRRRLAARAVEQRRRADRRRGATRWWARSAWTTSPSTSARTASRRALRGRARDPDRRAGQRADHRRGGRAAPGHDQLRGHLRADAARAARLSPRRRRRSQRHASRAHGGDASAHERRAARSRARRSPAGRAWLVGGAVRDRAARAADRPTSTSSSTAIPREAARAVAARGGAARRASRCRRSSARGGWSRATHAWQVDVEPLRGGLARGRPRAARLHGQRDRRADRRRRADRSARRPRGPARRAACAWPGRGAFADDPLRVLRLVRIAVELELEPEPQTLRARARARARRCAACRAERVFIELRRIIAAPRARRGLELLGELGATAVVLPELEALRGVEQNRFHHLDVYGHTLEVLDRTIELQADPGARSLGERARATALARAAGRAAGRRADARRGAALGGAAARRRQAADARGASRRTGA